jgi:hypothetical protein
MIEVLEPIVAGLMVFITLVLIETIVRLQRASKGS